LSEALGFTEHEALSTHDATHNWRSINVRAEEGKRLLLSGRFSEAVTVLNEAAAAAESESMRARRGDILNHLGIAYDRCQQYAKAVNCFERAIADFREMGDRSREAQAMGNIGSVWALKGDYDEAIEAHRVALRLAQDAGDRQTEEVQLDSLGVGREMLGPLPRFCRSA
jgi:tetratricopeptide (TPR) repeat protein